MYPPSLLRAISWVFPSSSSATEVLPLPQGAGEVGAGGPKSLDWGQLMKENLHFKAGQENSHLNNFIYLVMTVLGLRSRQGFSLVVA